jgi:photosystem II stability/assembly factor-like uncharacterized protein
VSARALLLGLLGSAAALGAQAAAPAAEHAPLAARGLLVAIAAAGARLVAVGDRGVVVYSDDGGRSWLQAESVPSQALLTGVCFFDARRGIAVGHDLTILTTGDAGRTWQRVHEDESAPGPLLDVWCGGAGQAIAVGAYSAYLASADAGASWQAQPFRPAPPPAAAAAKAAGEAAAGGFHLNRIAAAGGTRLYIAAEAGHLYRSDDLGASWRQLPSPYEGSFFGLLPLPGEALLAFGLRGNLFRSADAGATWTRLDSGTPAMLDGGTALPDGTVALVGLSGVVLVSHDGGRSFGLEQQADHSGLAAAAAAGEALVTVGEDGARRVALGAHPAGSAP